MKNTSLIQMNHLKYTFLIKPVSLSHPTLNLHCEINSTLFHPPINTTWKGGCKQSFLSSHSSSSCLIYTCEKTHKHPRIHLLQARRANLERSCMTSGQRVKGHREYWPLTLLDPIYWYNDHATVSTLCHQGAAPHIKWLHQSIWKIHTQVDYKSNSKSCATELMLMPEMHASHMEKNHFVPCNEKISYGEDWRGQEVLG